MRRFLSNSSDEDDPRCLVNIVEDTKVSDAQFPQGQLMCEGRKCNLQHLAILALNQGLMRQLLFDCRGDLAAVINLDRFQFSQCRWHDLNTERHLDSLWYCLVLSSP
jgi:hypothetical protein